MESMPVVYYFTCEEFSIRNHQENIGTVVHVICSIECLVSIDSEKRYMKTFAMTSCWEEVIANTYIQDIIGHHCK